MRRIATVFFLIAALLGSAPAQATQYLYTVSGSVIFDDFTYDQMEVFGPTLGSTFSAQFLVDDTSPLALYYYGPTGSSATGGRFYAPGTRPPATASITIGGVTHAVPMGDLIKPYDYDPDAGEFYGDFHSQQDRGQVVKDAGLRQLTLAADYSEEYSCCLPYHPYQYHELYDGLSFGLASPAFTSADYRQLGMFALAPGSSYGVYSANETFDPEYFPLMTRVGLRPETVSIEALGAVPEIATWLMMVAGVGAAGVSLRYRRSGRVARI